MGKLPRVAKTILADEFIGEINPKFPIMEISNDSRLYIERHMGVCEYSDTEIHIAVMFGKVIICGSNMKLTSMSKECLVITGSIERIAFVRG